MISSNAAEVHLAIAILLGIVAIICLIMGIAAYRAAHKAHKTWIPWPMNLDWAFAAFFLLADFPLYIILSLMQIGSKEAVPVWSIILVLNIAIWPIVLFFYWTNFMYELRNPRNNKKESE